MVLLLNILLGILFKYPVKNPARSANLSLLYTQEIKHESNNILITFIYIQLEIQSRCTMRDMNHKLLTNLN